MILQCMTAVDIWPTPHKQWKSVCVDHSQTHHAKMNCPLFYLFYFYSKLFKAYFIPLLRFQGKAFMIESGPN